MFGIDPIHLIIIFGGMALSLAAAGYVKWQFHCGKAVPLRSGIIGADIARRILRDQGIDDVEVVEHQGFLSDHYNPMAKNLALSPEVYNGSHAAAAGVAAHEVGHAIQHAHGVWHMWLRSVLVYPGYFGSMLGPILIMIGVFLAGGRAMMPGSGAQILALVGVGVFGLSTLCAFAIVHNEFNASSQARLALVRMGITDSGEEDSAVQKVLFAAGLTYLAAAVISLVELIYWAWQAGLVGGGRREE